jgi:hypothetical protein
MAFISQLQYRLQETRFFNCRFLVMNQRSWLRNKIATLNPHLQNMPLFKCHAARKRQIFQREVATILLIFITTFKWDSINFDQCTESMIDRIFSPCCSPMVNILIFYSFSSFLCPSYLSPVSLWKIRLWLTICLECDLWSSFWLLRSADTWGQFFKQYLVASMIAS